VSETNSTVKEFPLANENYLADWEQLCCYGIWIFVTINHKSPPLKPILRLLNLVGIITTYFSIPLIYH